MKRFACVLALFMAAAIPQMIYACPSGFEVSCGGEGSAGYCVVEVSDGYVAVGSVTDEYGFMYNLFMIKTAPWPTWPAETLWMRTHEDVPGVGRSIQKIEDGFIIAGYVPDYTDSGGPHVMLVKTDSAGEVLWDNRDIDISGEGYSVTPTSDGGYVIAGQSFYRQGELVHDLLLVKTDSAGDTIWTRSYGHESGNDQGYCIRETSNGNYVVAGTYGLSESYLGGKIWWMKVDSDGEVIWENTCGDDIHNNYRGYSIQETQDWGFIIVGGRVELTDTLPAHYLLLIKTDPTGEVQWLKEYFAGYMLLERIPWWAEQTTDGGYIVTGYPWMFLKTNADGDMLWTRHHSGYGMDWPGDVYGHYVTQASDGGYLAAGVDGDCFYLIKADPYGYIWIVDVNEEPPVPATPVTHTDWQISASVGRQIVLRYSNCPHGFSASIFDASGRKVDEVHATESSGMITWGRCYGPGVYFIVPSGGKSSAQKVVLIK